MGGEEILKSPSPSEVAEPPREHIYTESSGHIITAAEMCRSAVWYRTGNNSMT